MTDTRLAFMLRVDAMMRWSKDACRQTGKCREVKLPAMPDLFFGLGLCRAVPAETPHLPCRAGRGSPFAGIAAGRRPGRLLGRTLPLDVATPELSRSEGLQTDRTMVKRRGSTGSTSTGAPFVERIGQEGFQRSTNSKAEEGNKRQRGSGVAPHTIPPAFLRRTEPTLVPPSVTEGVKLGLLRVGVKAWNRSRRT
jgi:hypothetical protein